ncbi:putative lipoprotein [Leptospira wolbachii serovar Codice str. CDC]|uniref:Lipoprotein n=1 Tax=Leptospira wolbachii serovar Codice str. CDC TaxID=1218599 RepID=R9A0C6_9LEPT|nr:hypothetical protein [Leptospira wolbachii]EOQ95577.1 putative lipoprotein [Leptospira wolbachii serovar Codice str. CDC]
MKIPTLLAKFLTILMILSSLSCELLSKDDPDFADDIISGPEKFQYDPNKLPVIGKTTEQGLLEMYPKPWSRLTFRKPIVKEILGRKFEMKKIIGYVNYVTAPLPNGGYLGMDYLYFHIFFDKNGIVQQYIVDHTIKEKANRNTPWVYGKYSNIKNKKHWKEDDYWPESVVDATCYWAQRRDRKKYRHSEQVQCRYWDSVPVY